MGKVMLLRTCGPAGESHGGFVWPMTVGAEVVAPDWNPSPECGGGLHGLLWGEGDCSLIPTDGPRVWMACEADEADVVRIDSTKAKARSVRIVACGTREDATQAVYRAAPNGTRVHYLSMTGGYRSTLTGGDGSTLTGGDGSTLVWRIWDGLHRRIHVAYVGEDGIEPGVAYRWENGKATKVTA